MFVDHRANELGLDQAYASPKGIHVDGGTMSVAGTRSVRDAWDDLKIPFRQIDQTERFRDAERVFQEHGGVNKVVGHSLGGAVTLEMQKRNPGLETETNGAPVFSAQMSGQRHCRWRDPVCALDLGAKRSWISSPSILKNHTYRGIIK